jgi:DNA-binding MarR family transcriptional regulator
MRGDDTAQLLYQSSNASAPDHVAVLLAGMGNANASRGGLPTAVTIALMRAADVARREMVRALEPQGVTLQQANVLIILRQAGPEGLPTLAVAERLIEQTPAITQLIAALVAKKYVRRKTNRTDRRQQLCFLTAKGGQLIDDLFPVIHASHARITRNIPDEQLGALVELLTLIGGEYSPSGTTGVVSGERHRRVVPASGRRRPRGSPAR